MRGEGRGWFRENEAAVLKDREGRLWQPLEVDSKLWRVLHHYVDEARARVDMSNVSQIGVDEMASKRGQNYISHVVDFAARKLGVGMGFGQTVKSCFGFTR